MRKKPRGEDRLRRRRRAIAKGLPKVEETLRGSITQRYIECGKATCRCHEEGGHGPYCYFVVTKGVGKTISFRLQKREQAQRWVSNYRKLLKGLEKISDINRNLLRGKQS